MATTKKIAEAATYLSATQYDDDTFIYYDDAMSTWYRVTRDDLNDLAELLHDPDPDVRRDAYSHWCAGGAGEELSAEDLPRYIDA